MKTSSAPYLKLSERNFDSFAYRHKINQYAVIVDISHYFNKKLLWELKNHQIF